MLDRETVVLGPKRKDALVYASKMHLFPDVYITNDNGVFAATCGESSFVTDDVHTACARFLLASTGEWE